MTIFLHELRQSRIFIIIWTVSIAFMMGICVLIYPQMGDRMDEIGAVFAQMGGFSQAFGMDRLNFGEFLGFFSIECGNMLGLGGSFFAALCGISALSKEEREHTAEFLLTHPISIARVVTEKLLAAVTGVLILNVVIIAVIAVTMLAVGVTADINILALLFSAYFIMQLEILAVTFALSAFLRRGGIGLGLGLAAIFYFLNIISNLIENTEFIKYITPFGYTEGADIISSKSIDGGYLMVGLIITAAAVCIAYIKYTKKDIA